MCGFVYIYVCIPFHMLFLYTTLTLPTDMGRWMYETLPWTWTNFYNYLN